MSDFIVKIEYKNEKLETVVEKEYDFPIYTDMLYEKLMGVIAEIESAFYYFSDGKSKDKWDETTMSRFKSIRHKLLDEANALKRLPNNLTYKGISAATIPMSEYIARTLKTKM